MSFIEDLAFVMMYVQHILTLIVLVKLTLDEQQNTLD